MRPYTVLIKIDGKKTKLEVSAENSYGAARKAMRLARYTYNTNDVELMSSTLRFTDAGLAYRLNASR